LRHVEALEGSESFRPAGKISETLRRVNASGARGGRDTSSMSMSSTERPAVKSEAALRQRHYDVVIVGGGIVGCALARELSRYKLSVVVVEMYQEICFGTSKANSGIVHPGHHDKPGSVKGSLVVRGNQLIRELAAQLGFGYRQCGEVMVAKNEEEFEELKKLTEQARAQGVPVEIWDQKKLRQEEPNLSPTVVGGLYAPTCGVVSPYEMAHALMGVAANNGVELLANSPVVSIRVDTTADEANRLVVCTDTDRITCSFVVNAAGIWADKIANMVGIHTFTIKPRKGEEYLLDRSMHYLTSRVIFPVPTKVSKGILIIPTVDQTIMCGPTATDTEDRWDLSTTAEGCKTIFDFVKQMCPAINERYVIASFAGLRAASNTGDFIIGATAVPGFINAAGIQSPGLTSAPAIAERLVDALRTAGLETVPKDTWKATLDVTPRFFELSLEQQEARAKQNPAYGRVVCRCELVTEGDIHAAIDAGARCLDGVKFRTRAGMGRCAGGFCTSRIVQLLSQRLGIRLEDVTKRGRNSQILHSEIPGVVAEITAAQQPSSTSQALTGGAFPRVIDVAVIGGGPAGLAAGIGARQNGARDVVVFDREDTAGGILLQCVHSGFGLHYFKEELTGPEYAQRFLVKALEQKVRVCPASFVVDVNEMPGGNKRLHVLVAGQGIKTVMCRSLVLAMGCRERSRAAIRIPGTRPAGVFTAGLAQRFVNLHGHLPGKRIVILGSGDIGLIMARRMTLEHCEVIGVFEIMPQCSGLNRNVVQCLHDYGIPLYLSHTVVRIHGRDHLERVTVAPVDKDMRPIMEKAWDIDCDCLLLSVGLIPENEISSQLKIKFNGKTSGPTVSSSLMTSMPGVFACGNVLHVHDLVDNVSKEGLLAGRNAARWALSKDTVNLVPGENVTYVLPETLSGAADQVISLRVRHRISPALVRIGSLTTKHMPVAAPSEMIRITVKKEKIIRFIEAQLRQSSGSSSYDGTCTLAIDVVEDKEAEASGEMAEKPKEATAAATATATATAAEGQKGPATVALKEGQQQSTHICLSCPHGCECTVISEGKTVLSVVGASCARGWSYCEQEIRDPRRFFSTTVYITGAVTQKLPVKITKPLPKQVLVRAAAEIQKLTVHAPVKLGDVLIKDLLGEQGCDVVACRTLELAEEEYKKYSAAIEFTTSKASAPDIAVVHDSHDGHAEAAATIISDDLQAQGFENAIGSPDELGLTLATAAALRVAVFCSVSLPESSEGGVMPVSYRKFAEELAAAAPGSLSKLHYALFSVSGVPGKTAIDQLGKLLQRAGAVELFNTGFGTGELSSGGYLRQVEEWAATGLADAVLPFIQPKSKASESEKQKPHTRRPAARVDWEEEGEAAAREQARMQPLNVEELPECYCKSDAAKHYSIADSPDKWLNCIVSRTELCENIVELRVVCPTVAQFCEPGQFVMVCADTKSERIPLTIADFSRAEGWITLVIQNVGLSSAKLCALRPGQRIRDIAGPLGHKSEIEDFHGTVICAGGGVGVAPVFPIMRALRMAGNRVIGVIGSRTKDLIVWESRMRQYCDELRVTTDDGSYGEKGFVSTAVAAAIQREAAAGRRVVRVVAIGPGPMMRACVEATPKDIPVIVSLNTIMIDGTGMCFTPDTPVRMADGSVRTIEEVAVGDRVATPRGSAEVSRVSRDSGPLFTVSEVSRGQKLPLFTVNGDHVLALYRADGTLVHYTVTEFLQLAPSTRASFRHAYCAVENNKAITAETKALYWLAGGWCGNGDKTRARWITGPLEVDFRNAIHNALRVLGYSDDDIHVDKGADICISVHKHSTSVAAEKNVWSFLAKHFGAGKDKQIGDSLVTAPKAARMAFLGGFIDSNGHVRVRGNSLEVSIKTVRKHHAEALRCIARSLCVPVHLDFVPTHVDDKGVRHADAWSVIFKSAYQTAMVCQASHTRKGHVPDGLLRHRGERYMHGNHMSTVLDDYDNKVRISIAPAGEGKFVGLTLAHCGDGHHFLLADGSIVHNCGGCRVSADGKTAFVCVDGPEFDGRTVDWGLLATRMAAYRPHEQLALEARQKGTAAAVTAAGKEWVTPKHDVPGRVPMPAQDPQYRSHNFDEVALGYTPEMALAEASRCKQCENATCQDGCPVGVDIRGFIKLVQQRKFRAAARLIRRTHACPAICGRVCPQETQCEAVCYLKAIEKRESVAIGNLERFVADWDAAHPAEQEDDSGDTAAAASEEKDREEAEAADPVETVSIADKRVAIIGAGPAGLICAAEVAKAGAKVTVFEALSTAGGVLVYGIPSFRLPKSIVERETSYIRDDLGVEFRFNWPVGPAGSVPQMLREGFSAVFIGTGAGLPWFLGIEGENLKGVYSSNEFLTRVNLMKAYRFPDYPTPVLLGESIAVVGGGNVAMDAARCAKRLGAKNVYILYRRTRKEMPARLDEVHHALEEGIIFRELVAPTKVIGDASGCVSAIELQICELGAPDASGRRKPILTSKFETLPIQQLVVAVGNGPNPLLGKAWPELKQNDKGHIVVDKSQATNIPGVYAGGDIATGAATVIEAMGAGKRAAASIIKYLRGK